MPVAGSLRQPVGARRLLDRLRVRPHLDEHLRETDRGAGRGHTVTPAVGGAQRPPVEGLGRARLATEHLLGAARDVRRREEGRVACRGDVGPRRVSSQARS